MAFVNDVIDQIGETTGITDINHGLREGDIGRALHGLKTLSGGPRDTGVDPFRQMWTATNTSYSGTDVVPIAQINGSLITLGGIQTISISTFREKEPIRVLGKSYVKGYTGGPRTIGGSITFALFDRDPMWEIIRYLREDIKTASDRYHTPIGDQIPPINLILWFSNEYGRKSIQTIYGLEFVGEGQVHSINDVYSEKTVNYKARDMDILLDYQDIQEFRNLMYERQLTGQFTDNYLASLLEYKKNIEKQIADTNAVINRINVERGKRGIVSFGALALFGIRDLKDEMERQVTKKKYLTRELINVDAAINSWSRTLYDSESYFGGDGSAVHDNLKQASVAGRSSPDQTMSKLTRGQFINEYDDAVEAYKKYSETAPNYDIPLTTPTPQPAEKVVRGSDGNPEVDNSVVEYDQGLLNWTSRLPKPTTTVTK